jgi:hypothetical protein
MVTDTFKSNKKLVTIVHFNRIAMQRGSEYVWTVHNSLGCFQVKDVKIRCAMDTIFKKDGPQPRAKFKGKAFVEVSNGVATLT